jgi:ribosomal protein L21E
MKKNINKKQTNEVNILCHLLEVVRLLGIQASFINKIKTSRKNNNLKPIKKELNEAFKKLKKYASQYHTINKVNLLAWKTINLHMPYKRYRGDCTPRIINNLKQLQELITSELINQILKDNLTQSHKKFHRKALYSIYNLEAFQKSRYSGLPYVNYNSSAVKKCMFDFSFNDYKSDLIKKSGKPVGIKITKEGEDSIMVNLQDTNKKTELPTRDTILEQIYDVAPMKEIPKKNIVRELDGGFDPGDAVLEKYGEKIKSSCDSVNKRVLKVIDLPLLNCRGEHVSRYF